MGTSTDGQISFGIKFEEDHEFPWDDDRFDADIDQWWREVNGYREPFACFDEEGSYLPGFTNKDPRIAEYFKHQREWDKDNPLPIDLVNYQSSEYPAWIIAWPASVKRARRGYPEELTTESLTVAPDAAQALLAFCTKYGIDSTSDEDDEQSNQSLAPKWWLSSYWG